MDYCSVYEKCREKPLEFVTQRDLVTRSLTDNKLAVCSNCGQIYNDNNGTITVYDRKRFVPLAELEKIPRF